MLDDVCALIRENERFVVTTHLRPDGDALGSQCEIGLKGSPPSGKNCPLIGHDLLSLALDFRLCQRRRKLDLIELIPLGSQSGPLAQRTQQPTFNNIQIRFGLRAVEFHQRIAGLDPITLFDM